MKLGSRRVRSIAGFVALLALTVSFSEAVWASTCLPGMGMDDSAAVSGASALEPVQHTPTGADDRDEPQGGDDHRPCPFASPLAAQACAGVSSMPAPSTESSTPVAEVAEIGFTVAALHELLLDVALFRPPRA